MDAFELIALALAKSGGGGSLSDYRTAAAQDAIDATKADKPLTLEVRQDENDNYYITTSYADFAAALTNQIPIQAHLVDMDDDVILPFFKVRPNIGYLIYGITEPKSISIIGRVVALAFGVASESFVNIGVAKGAIPGEGTSTPAMDGIASVGSSVAYAHEDHVHPSDTSKADASTEITVTTAGDVSQVCADNTVYTFTGELTSLTLTEASGAREYLVIFTTGSTAPTVTFPSGVVFPDTLTIEANKRYEVSVRDGYAVAQGWEVSA